TWLTGPNWTYDNAVADSLPSSSAETSSWGVEASLTVTAFASASPRLCASNWSAKGFPATTAVGGASLVTRLTPASGWNGASDVVPVARLFARLGSLVYAETTASVSSMGGP